MSSLAAPQNRSNLGTRRQNITTIDQVMVEERAAAFTKRSIKTSAKLAGLKLAISMMDLTTLEGKDTPGKVAFLCRKAMQPIEPRYDVPPCAAVCVYPNFVRAAKKFLGDSGVKVASVATGFPSGLMPLRLRLEEVRSAARDGADEIDMVIDRGVFLAGNHTRTADEISAIKEACGDAHLKVILETGELNTYDNVRMASDIAMRAGADFIKNLHRQSLTGRHPPRHARDARSDPGLLLRNRHPHWNEARRRHSHREAGARVSGDG
jgi:deoxyribose-phosphate aldolase